jgi:hypothetical protein
VAVVLGFAYRNLCGEYDDAEEVVAVQVAQYGRHGLLQLLDLATDHGPTDVQHKGHVFP